MGLSRFSFLLLGLALGGFAAAEAQSGDFLAQYKRGLQAYEEGRFQEAAQAMEAAVAGRSDSSPRLALRLYLKPYIPHFYLGSSYFQMGDCNRAVPAWNESERQGVIARLPQIRELRRWRALCTEKLSEHATALAAAETAVGEARGAFAAVSDLSNARELGEFWSEGRPPREERRRLAEERLARAERRLEQGRGRLSTTAPLEEAAAIASEAQALFTKLAVEAEAHRRELARREEEHRRQLAALEEQARRVLQQAAALPADSPTLRRMRRELRQDVERVSAAEGRGPARDLRRLEESLSELRGILRGPSGVLEEGAESYLAGRYEEVLTTLAGELPADPREAAHTLLLRAAAAFGIHRRTPGGNEVLRSQARADLLFAAPDLPIPPGPRVFSPAFRKFFVETIFLETDFAP